MKINKLFKIMILIVLMIFLLSGNTFAEIDIKKIKNDIYGKKIGHGGPFGGTLYETTLNENIIENIEIVNIEDQGNTQNVQVNLKLNDQNMIIKIKMLLQYNYYENSGWVLEDNSYVKENPIEYIPTRGVTKEKIKETLVQNKVNIYNNGWEIEKDEIKSINIQDRSTNLELKQDYVIADLVVSSEAIRNTGTMKLKFKFNNANWYLDDYNIINDFSYEPLKEIDISKEQIKKDLVGQEFRYEDKLFGASWKIEKEDIKKLNIYDSGYSNKEGLRFYLMDIVLEQDIQISGKLKIFYRHSEKPKLIEVKNASENSFAVKYIPLPKKYLILYLDDERIYFNEDDYWVVVEDEFETFEIYERKTDKENNKDIIYANILIKEDNELLEGKIKIVNTLTKNGWKISKIEKVNDLIYKEF